MGYHQRTDCREKKIRPGGLGDLSFAIAVQEQKQIIFS